MAQNIITNHLIFDTMMVIMLKIHTINKVHVCLAHPAAGQSGEGGLRLSCRAVTQHAAAADFLPP